MTLAQRMAEQDCLTAALDEVRDRKPGRPPERELTAAEVKEIRRRRLRGEILRTIAQDFGITISRVSLIGLRYQRRKGRQAPKELYNADSI